MNSAVSTRTQRLFVWSGLGCLVLMGVGLLFFAGCVPPPAPTHTSAEIVAFYSGDPVRIRAGFAIAMFGCALIIPFTVVLFLQMRRIEGQPSPWAYLQLAAGVADMFVFILPLMILQTAVYRIDELAPETVRMLNDMAWILFVGPPSMIVLQMISVAGVVLQDRSPAPLIPRWVGYYNLWAALVSACGTTVPFFKTGPLAWDGLFTYWIPVAAFVGFVGVNGIAVHRAVGTPATEAELTASPSNSMIKTD